MTANSSSGVHARVLVAFVGFALAVAPLRAQGPSAPGQEEEKERVGGSALEPPPEETTVATRTPQPVELAPSSVTTITGQQVRMSGARYLTDVLRAVPGVEVQRVSSTESNVSVRGYNDAATASQGMMALVDGRQVYNEFLGSVLWDAIPVSLEDIDLIEVIRGPGSFVYGPNAMHGLVNIRTRSPLDYEHNTVSMFGAVGSYRTSIAGLTHVRRGENTAWKTTLGWDDISEFFDKDDSARGRRFLELRCESLINGDEQHRLDVAGGLSAQDLDILIPTVGDPPLQIPSARLANEVDEAFLRARYEYHDLKVQVSWTGFDSTSTPERVYTEFDLDLDMLDADVQYSFAPVADNHFTVGAGYRFSTFETSDQDVADGRHDIGLGWAFVQDEVELSDAWFLTAGVRWDHHSEAGSSFSPRLALVWGFADRQSLRVSYGHGFRYPSLRELWFDMPVILPGPTTVTVVGNQDLDAERIQSFEVGYRLGPAGGGDDDEDLGSFWERLRLGATGYYNLVDDLVDFGQVAPLTFAPQNQDDEEAYGLELESAYSFSDTVSAFANYSYGIRQDRATGERDPLAPRHKANVGVRVATRGGFRASLWANFFDEIELFGITVDAYTLVSGHLSYHFDVGETKAHVFLQAFNLLDVDHKEHPQGDAYGEIVTLGMGVRW